MRSARAFLGRRDGNFALGTAVLAPLLVGLAGGVTDFFVLQHHRSELQSAADAAVIAAVAEAGFKGWSEESAKQVASAVIQSHLSNRFSGASFEHELAVDPNNRAVELQLTQDHYGYFVAGYFTGSPQIRVGASARATGQSTICIIVQDPSGTEAMLLGDDSKVTAGGCSAYSNSASTSGIVAEVGSKLTTRLACSAGGFSGPTGSFSPLPLTDCPAIEDPLVGRATLVDDLVADAVCDHKGLSILGGRKTLSPGVYCGGLDVSEAAEVTFQPGLYIMKDGPLKVGGESSISGTNLGFVFMGDKSRAVFKHESSISLSAPESGPMAGLLMYAQPSSKLREFKIASRDAQKLIGTVYLPQDHLAVGGDKDGDGTCDLEAGEQEDDDDGEDGDGEEGEGGAGPLTCEADVGSASAWTAIVAKTMEVTKGVELVVNSDYAASPVPAPPGIGPNSSRVLLER